MFTRARHVTVKVLGYMVQCMAYANPAFVAYRYTVEHTETTMTRDDK